MPDSTPEVTTTGRPNPEHNVRMAGIYWQPSPTDPNVLYLSIVNTRLGYIEQCGIGKYYAGYYPNKGAMCPASFPIRPFTTLDEAKEWLYVGVGGVLYDFFTGFGLPIPSEVQDLLVSPSTAVVPMEWGTTTMLPRDIILGDLKAGEPDPKWNATAGEGGTR